jgi:uncharacterized membrane protein
MRLKQFFLDIEPSRFFLLIALAGGLLSIVLTPPFQVPDEPSHFYRAWQISEGNFISDKSDARVGGILPSPLKQFSDNFSSITWYGPHSKYHFADIYASSRIYDLQNRSFIDFNNSAVYSPICYLPPALAIALCNAVGLPMFVSLYCARLFSLLAWIIILYATIRILPCCKWLFTFLALLPMSLFINSSLSADVITNAVCFLFFGVFLFYHQSGKKIGNGDAVFLTVIVLLVVSVKSVYFPLILLLFFIPASAFTSKTRKFITLGVICLAALAGFIFWNKMSAELYLSYNDYNPLYRDKVALVKDADMQQQMKYITSHGTYFLNVITASLEYAFPMYFYGYIGTFGWLDLPLPKSIVWITYFLLLSVALLEERPQRPISPRLRIVFILIFVLVFSLVLISQHLIWDPVGGDRIGNVQGRYLIPFAPLFFLAPIALIRGKTSALITIAWIPFIVCWYLLLLYSRYF